MENENCIASGSITFGQTEIQGYVSLDFDKRNLKFSIKWGDGYGKSNEYLDAMAEYAYVDVEIRSLIFGSLPNSYSGSSPVTQLRFWGSHYSVTEIVGVHDHPNSSRIEVAIDFREWLEVGGGTLSDSFSGCTVKFADIDTLMGANVHQQPRDHKIHVRDEFQLTLYTGRVKGYSSSLTLKEETVKSDSSVSFEFANPRSLTKIRQEIGFFKLYSAVFLGKWSDGLWVHLQSGNDVSCCLFDGKINSDDEWKYIQFTLFDIINQYPLFREKIINALNLAENLFEVFQPSPRIAHFKQSVDLGELLIKTFEPDVLSDLKNEKAHVSVKDRMTHIQKTVEGLVELTNTPFGLARNEFTHATNANMEMAGRDWSAATPLIRAYILKHVGVPEYIIRQMVR